MLCMKVTKQVSCHDLGYLPVGAIIHMDDERQSLVDRWVALGYAVQLDEYTRSADDHDEWVKHTREPHVHIGVRAITPEEAEGIAKGIAMNQRKTVLSAPRGKRAKPDKDTSDE